jgi:beta-phosphoglucomutase family hydrolase
MCRSGDVRSAVRFPVGISACLFDLDGVITQTAKAHAAAWKRMFDDFLSQRGAASGTAHSPFVLPDDYVKYVDGKLRADGVRAFLTSRGIVLPEGSTEDSVTAETVHGLGLRKNAILLDVFRKDGVDVYQGSLRLVRVVRELGHRVGVVSASKNCRAALAAAGIENLFEVAIDGVVAQERRLRGKPAPDMFLAAAAALDAAPKNTAVFEDALAGVEAARAGSFGWVVGVDRIGQAAALRAHGADIVVNDLAELLEET